MSVDRAKAYIMEFLGSHPCVDCGEADPVVLQFDHRDPAEKEGHVSMWVTRGYGVSRIQKEIAKCDVRCANCHTRRTAEQFGWWKVK